MNTYPDTSIQTIHEVMAAAAAASIIFSKVSIADRAAFMHAIANGLENSGDDLIRATMAETHLPEARLRGERARTVFQLRNYADACVQGDWLDARIDTADAHKVPAKPDIRKMLVPLGPVVVFGSSNFPFAYSTAGGDTASAFAAGCPVIVKAHPAHPHTSTIVAGIIRKAVAESGLPSGVFAHVYGNSFEVGEALVMHPATKAVGFTGSFKGGKALFDLANQRKEPIPVFAEMGSVNPVYLLPKKLELSATEMAAQFAASITLGVGQFCTNPGLILGVKSDAFDRFADTLSAEILKVAAGTMLHDGILKAYHQKLAAALAQPGVQAIAEGAESATQEQAVATIATVSGAAFMANPLLHQEVFGPYSLLVACENIEQLQAIASVMEGQLTSTIMATEDELKSEKLFVTIVAEKCGRIIFNGVPTGVEVCHSMQHGGPYPACTDSRFTSVGADAIKRFARPLAYQNWPGHLLPAELQNTNPLKLLRSINGQMSRNAIA
ncbi:MAG TPA: aldehyde dehydrogenase (NADP(+)) [Phnomibacter sp.]|nr:aldehyde dehydrogenase (NADP(+)) [Phnomibacter sp.]